MFIIKVAFREVSRAMQTLKMTQPGGLIQIDKINRVSIHEKEKTCKNFVSIIIK